MPVSLYTVKSYNIRKSLIYLTSFFVLVILFGWLITYSTGNEWFLIIAIIYSLINSFIAYFYSDKIVLKLYQAKPVTIEDNPELYRIVENLSITAGIPKPKIYLINDSSPNAFATGRNPKKAVIAVTRGLLEKLDRSELEGVLAHEISHIINRDTLISTLVVVLVSIIALVSHLFLRFSFWFGFDRRERERGGGLFLILALIGAILTPIVATLIQAAISRRREFIADSNGALLTRYPEGLIRALIKISSDPKGIKRANEYTAHLWIDNPIKNKEKSSFYKLFMTHPPIEDRIKALKGMIV